MPRVPSIRALPGAFVLLAAVLAVAPAGATPVDSLPPAAAPAPAVPLLFDSADMGFGVSVVFTRLPNAADLTNLSYFENLQHVVVSLPAWPDDAAAIAPLAQLPLPMGADLVVLLPGYPATHAALDAWNHLGRPVRLIMLVDGPPVDRGMILEMNAMRGLARVVATMAYPARTGFERLQRPLSFRVVRP